MNNHPFPFSLFIILFCSCQFWFLFKVLFWGGSVCKWVVVKLRESAVEMAICNFWERFPMDLENGAYHNLVKVRSWILKVLLQKLQSLNIFCEFSFFFFPDWGSVGAERVLENNTYIGLSEFGSCIWWFEYITIVCVQEHFFWRYSPLRDQWRNLWGFVPCLLDIDYGPSSQVCLHCAQSRWQWWRGHICFVLTLMQTCQSQFVA